MQTTKITAKIKTVEAGSAKVYDAASGRFLGRVERDHLRSSVGTFWYAKTAGGRDLGRADTRDAAAALVTGYYDDMARRTAERNAAVAS